jgi:hypothetical protein
MKSRIKIALGALEFEYEGETEFSIEDIKDLFVHIESMAGASGLSSDSHSDEIDNNHTGKKDSPVIGEGVPHVDQIAKILDAKNNGDVVFAAGVFLALTKRNSPFNRADLLKTAKMAGGFYQKSIASNLTAILNSLVGSRFNKISESQYTVKKSELEAAEARIAGSI